MSKAHLIALRICLIYAVVAGAWILISDSLIPHVAARPTELAWFQATKGWAFGLVTTVLIYLIARAQVRRVEAAAAAGRQAEAVHRERGVLDARLAHIAASVPGVILSYERLSDGTDSFPFVSAAAEAFYGYAVEAITADSSLLFRAVDARDASKLARSIEESARSLAPWRCEFRYLHPEKGSIWLEGCAIPERRPSGATLWNGFVMDVTERKRAELRIHQLNRVHAVLSEINQTIVRLREPQPLFESVCRIAVEHGGFRMAWVGRVDEATGKIVPIAHAGAVNGYLDLLDLNVRADRSTFGPTALAIASGRHIVCNDIAVDPVMAHWRDAAVGRGYLASAAFPIRVHGVVAGVLNLYAEEAGVFDEREVQLLDDLAVDLSFALEVGEQEARRLRAEASLRENEERFRQMAENIREVFWLAEPDHGGLLYVSPVYETVWGRPVETLYGNPRGWLDAVHPEDHDRVARATEAGVRHDSYDQEYRVVRPDGAIRWVRARAFPVRDAAGKVYRVAGVAEDVTERKQLEEQFLRAQRLDAIGMIAGGIAHDLNNVLAPIMMCAPMLRMAVSPGDRDRMVATIEAGTRRGADLVRQLLLFGRGVEAGRSAVAVGDLLLEVQKIACETFPKNIVVHLSHPGAVGSVLADATQLHQVLLNLCVNARDAMPTGGELRLSAEDIELTAKHPLLPPGAEPGHRVRIRVADTGTGIEPELVNRIFDPFFTTKPQGRGTGLGLSTVLGIVKNHGGFVRLHTEVGRGSTFDIYLPAQAGAAAPENHDGAADVPRGQDELILVVDDEQSIREVVADVLIRHGYRVITAEDGVAARGMFERNAAEVALVVTDLDMPRLDGLGLLQAIRSMNARVPVIVSSGLQTGRGPDNRTVELEQAGVTAALAKPFTRHDILTAIHSALAAIPQY